MFNMQHKFLIIVLTLILVPLISSAEFYKFRDESGVLHYTDDLTEIPKDQHPQMETYRGTANLPVPELKQQKTENEIRIKLSKNKAALDEEYKELMEAKQALGTSQTESMKSTKAHDEKRLQLKKRIADFEKRRQTIRNSKEHKELKKKYKELTKTKQALDAQTKSMKIPVDAKAHNEKVLQLNERIADFEKRRQTIRKKVDAFNEPKIASTDTD